MAVVVLTVDQTPTSTGLLEFAQPAGTALMAYGNADPVTGYPPATSKFRYMEADLSIDTDINGTYVWGLAMDPLAIQPVAGTTSPGASGTWTGAGGSEVLWSGDLNGWKIPDFGAWETDYITFTTSSTQPVYGTGAVDAGWTTWPLDIQFRTKRANWDDGFGTLLGLDGVSNQIFRTTTGIRVRWSSGGTQDREASWASLGVTDGEWAWLRITADDTNGLRWWTSSDGASWSDVHTEASITGLESKIGTTAVPRIGSGTALGGWDGDISDMTLGTLGGSQVWSFNLDAVESATDTAWSSDGGVTDWVRDSSSAPVVVGAIRGTETIRFTPDNPMTVGDVRFALGANDDGLITVDTMTFDLGNIGWKVGTT